MKTQRPAHLEAVATPETAVWMLYAGLVQGSRWRRFLTGHPAPKAVPALPRGRGVAQR